MKCPKCGSKNVQGTNWGKRVLSATGGFMAASGVALFTKIQAKHHLQEEMFIKQSVKREHIYV